MEKGFEVKGARRIESVGLRESIEYGMLPKETLELARSELEFKKLYKVLVVGGAMATMGCGTTQTKSKPTPEPKKPQPKATDKQPTKVELKRPQKPVPKGVDCNKLCHGEGGNRVCPDPQLKAENCCWLMTVRHVCCN